MLCDYPEAYDHNPDMEFLDKVPTVWEDTKVLNGEPAEYVTIARQHGDTWYLGSMTNWEARDLELPLNFLGKSEYEAQIFSDGPDADTIGTSLSINTRRVKAGDKLNVHLAPGGGVAVIFTPRP
jgi:alpha-glucosidase